MKTTFIGMGCLLLGLFIGIWVPVDLDPAEDAVTQISSIPMLDKTVPDPGRVVILTAPIDPTAEDETTGNESADDSGRPGGSENTVLVSTDLIAELSQRSSSRNFGQVLIEPEGNIEQALGMTEQEQSLIQTNWDALKQQIRELEVASSKVEEMDDLSVKITLPEMQSGMNALSGQFRESVQQALGQNRGDVFLAAKQIDPLMAKTSAERTYTIVAESPKEGEWRFNMTLESPEGRRVWVGESIPDEIRHLTDAAQIFPTISDLPDEAQ